MKLVEVSSRLHTSFGPPILVAFWDLGKWEIMGNLGWWNIMIEQTKQKRSKNALSNMEDESVESWRLTWNIIMEVWKNIFLSKWVIHRFHVTLLGCISFRFHVRFLGCIPSKIKMDRKELAWNLSRSLHVNFVQSNHPWDWYFSHRIHVWYIYHTNFP